jgi:translation initiation factor IF-2
MLAPARRGTFLVLMGAFLVSVALTVGVAVRGPTPVAVSAPEPVAPAGDTPSGDAPPRPSFRAVAGPACPVNASQDVRISAGWQVVPGDSWTGDGCGNRFLYSSPDDENHVQWRFTLDGPADRTCRIAVFIPGSAFAASRVWYGVTDQFENIDHRVGGFSLDQKANRGRWVDAATIPNDTGTLLVNLNGDQGLAGTTAGPLRVTCTDAATGP